MAGRNQERPDEAHDEPETALVARAKGDRRAFVPLYARYLGPILRYCGRRLPDQNSAEDAAAQIFAQAMANIGGCRDDAFRPWLFTIAHHVVVDHYRRRKPTTGLDAALDRIDPNPTPEEITLEREDRAALHALLTHLTPDQRRVVELRLAGLTGIEIADALGLSHGAVKVHQFRAIRRLRTALGITVQPDVPGSGRTKRRTP